MDPSVTSAADGFGEDEDSFELHIAALFEGRFTIVGDCWEFTGGRSGGYGHMTHNGQQVSVHRHVLSLWLGRPVQGFALHRCDNPPCFRPRHIYEGDARQNAADRVAAGHQACCERGGRARLTREAVIALRRDRAAGMTYKQLGRRYGVSSSAAESAARGASWSCVPPHPGVPAPEPLAVTRTDVVTVFDLTALGLTYRMVDHWTRKGYLRPVNPATGPGLGHIRIYATEEREVADVMRRLVAAGVTPSAAHTAARNDGRLSDEVRVVITEPAQAAA